MIYIINGFSGSGKSTFCELVTQDLCRGEELSMVGWIKSMAVLFGWDLKRDEKGRQLLVDLKDASEAYNDGPLKRIDIEIQHYIDLYEENGFFKENQYCLFINARSKSDIEKLKEKYNCKTILIIRDNLLESFSNHADKEVMKYTDYDYFIKNNGTIEDFRNTIKEFLKQEGIELK